jgi:integrase
MARVFRQTYTKPLPAGAVVITRKGQKLARYKDGRGKVQTAPLSQDGTKIILKAGKHYIDYKDAHGVTRRVPGFKDEKASQQYANELEKLAERVRCGCRPKEYEQLKRPLREHLSEFKAYLLAKGTSEVQARQVHNRALAILEACRFVLWADVQAAAVQAHLAKLRKGTKGHLGISAQTSNGYLLAFKHFCKWLQADERAPGNPVVYLQGLNVKVDRRHDRRALSPEECRKLLATAAAGPIHLGMPGAERALLYRTALESGLRAGELKTLTVGACDLVGGVPTLTVRAGYSKHRREDVQPIPPTLAYALRQHVGGRAAEELVFGNMPRIDNLSRMLQADLGRAEIPYRDTAGRVADFHALRHTYITNLALAGVHPKTAMDLARHSDINLTMARYSHTALRNQAQALSGLPDLSAGEPKVVKLRATGTDDRVANRGSDDKPDDKLATA